MARYLLFVLLVVWLMAVNALPARRRPSFSSIEDDMMPAMVMMPSFVYYHVMSPYHSPFLRMAKSMEKWPRFAVESSEEQDDEEEAEKEEESDKKLVESQVNKTTSAEVKEFNVESSKEEETTENATEETVEVNESTTEIQITETPIPQTTNGSIAGTKTATGYQQSISIEDKLSIKPDNSIKNSERSSSTTYVCKFGKCQHTMEAKKILEEEIEAELWAKW